MAAHRRHEIKDRYIHQVGPMRELLTITASTQLGIFNAVTKTVNHDTLVESLSQYRGHGFTGYDFIDIISPQGSRDQPTTVFYARLSLSAGDKLITHFNDPQSDLRVMILPYEVGGCGINLQKAFLNVIVGTAVKNQGIETQADQEHAVEVLKLYARNSICTYREHRKGNRFVMELATRPHDPDIRQLLVDVLNNYQNEVRDAYEKYSQMVLKLKKIPPPVVKEGADADKNHG
ncbi:hypothetical protein BCR34DRAFT_590752 [Clohesyomyces aquaticus]|uniref:Uncharacterized protein n=1 Tax=Clohesyomyces aquaticus TaxID=1231657 RepID=A0A1Y1Z7W6_9PLEO|nr:hypothetical protein BCR34DRAFT_590752 [Clohesyomyces aquaticus]